MVEQALPIVKGYEYRLRVTATGGDAAVFPEGSKIRAQVRDYLQSVNLRAELTFENGGLRRVSADTIDMIISEAETAAIRNTSVVVEFSRTDIAPKAYLYLMLNIPVARGQFQAPVVVTVKPALAVSLSTPPTFYGGLAGVATGTCTATGTLSVVTGVLLAGSALGSGSAAGSLSASVNASLAGAAVGSGSGSGTLFATLGTVLAGNATGTGSGSGTLASKVTVLLAGSAVGAGTGSGALVSGYLPSTASTQYVWGTSKGVSSYSGPALRVQRDSDSTQQDIGFVGQDLDTAAILAFTGLSTIRGTKIAMVYEQRGSGLPLYQNTASAMPILEEDYEGKPVLYCDISTSKFFTADVPTTANALTAFMLGNASQGAFLQLGATSFAFGPAVALSYALTFGNTARSTSLKAYANTSVFSLQSGASTLKQGQDLALATASGVASATASTTIRVGTASTSASDARIQLFVLNAALVTDAEALATKQAMMAMRSIPNRAGQRTLTYTIDSLSFGFGSTFGRHRVFYALQDAAIRAQVKVYRAGVTGREIDQAITDYPTEVAPAYDAGAPINVIAFFAGTNDLGNSRTDPTTRTRLQNYYSAANATGFKLVAYDIPKVLTNEADRVSYNAWLDANYLTYAVAKVDFQTVTLSAVANVDMADGLHPNSSGYLKWANYEVPILKTALGI